MPKKYDAIPTLPNVRMRVKVKRLAAMTPIAGLNVANAKALAGIAAKTKNAASWFG